ncbi:MAG: hypothetical protein AB7W37_11705, partial [Syntrophobacteraceae bacterium]
FVLEVLMFVCLVILAYMHLYDAGETKPALILMDCWAPPDSEAKQPPVISESYDKIMKVLAFARANGWHVMHLPHGRKINDLVRPVDGEFVRDGKSVEPINYLIDNKITELYYVGYASNVCVINRMPYGLLNMLRYGYKCTFIEDASEAAPEPPPNAIVCEGGHEGAIKEVLKHGGYVIRSVALLK